MPQHCRLQAHTGSSSRSTLTSIVLKPFMLEGGDKALTSSKQDPRNSDAMQTAANNIDTPGHEVCVHLRPAKPGSNLDCLGVHIYHYVTELCHRDVDTQSGREAWVGSMASAFDCERYTGPGELMELRFSDRATSQKQ